jgi:hypothetical protein
VRLQSSRCRPASGDRLAIYQILSQGIVAGSYIVLSPIFAPGADEVFKADGSAFHLDGPLQGVPCAKFRHFRQAFTRHNLLIPSARKAGHRFAIAKLGKKLVSEDEPRVS